MAEAVLLKDVDYGGTVQVWSSQPCLEHIRNLDSLQFPRFESREDVERAERPLKERDISSLPSCRSLQVVIFQWPCEVSYTADVSVVEKRSLF